jgi:hypothetical protein
MNKHVTPLMVSPPRPLHQFPSNGIDRPSPGKLIPNANMTSQVCLIKCNPDITQHLPSNSAHNLVPSALDIGGHTRFEMIETRPVRTRPDATLRIPHIEGANTFYEKAPSRYVLKNFISAIKRGILNRNRAQ